MANEWIFAICGIGFLLALSELVIFLAFLCIAVWLDEMDFANFTMWAYLTVGFSAIVASTFVGTVLLPIPGAIAFGLKMKNPTKIYQITSSLKLYKG